MLDKPHTHIDAQGRFQSDKNDLPPDKVALSFNDTTAWPALRLLAGEYWKVDRQFAEDIMQRLIALGDETAGQWLVVFGSR